jgi:hypothetical protein
MGDGALLGLAGELTVADLLGFVALETLGSGVGDSVATAELGGGAGGSLVAGVVSVMGCKESNESASRIKPLGCDKEGGTKNGCFRSMT